MGLRLRLFGAYPLSAHHVFPFAAHSLPHPLVLLYPHSFPIPYSPFNLFRIVSSSHANTTRHNNTRRVQPTRSTLTWLTSTFPPVRIVAPGLDSSQSSTTRTPPSSFAPPDSPVDSFVWHRNLSPPLSSIPYTSFQPPCPTGHLLGHQPLEYANRNAERRQQLLESW